MRLTSFSDYAFRLLIFAASHGDRLVTIEEAARKFAISRAHLMKVANELTRAGFLKAVRGRSGGLTLGRPAEVWMNRSENSGHWLEIALEGTKSNRDGIGATIQVVTTSGTQYNHMTTAAGYASSSDGPVPFGLGRDKTAKTVEIRWPSGVVQTLRDVKADRVLAVKETGP